MTTDIKVIETNIHVTLSEAQTAKLDVLFTMVNNAYEAGKPGCIVAQVYKDVGAKKATMIVNFLSGAGAQMLKNRIDEVLNAGG